VTSTAVGQDGIGVAPGARWMACRNMDNGLGAPVTYLLCLNFFLAPHDLDGRNPRPERRPHVIGNSYGCPDSEGCSKRAMRAAVEALRAAGVFMSVSAGNEGPSCGSVDAPPALEPLVFSVGATDDTDNLARFSSRGPVTVDGQQWRKPDISAPGVNILAAYPGNEGMRRLSGTSKPSPHVSGAVILLTANCPCLERDNERLQAVLQSSAVHLLPPAGERLCGVDTARSVPNNFFGYGRIDVERGVKVCMELCAAFK
jgi:subtilisin family serine protease